MDQLNRDYGALLAERRSDLLTPVHTILGTAQRMLVDGGEEVPQDFAGDVRNIITLAADLANVFGDMLRPENLTSLNLSEEQRAKLRHDLLNKFNGILMACDLWIEEIQDEDDQLLSGFLVDFQLMDDSARRSVELIDSLLGEWSEAADESVDGLDATSSVDHWIPSTPQNADEIVLGHILIVDDHDISRNGLQRELSVRGHKVTTAPDGLEAWHQLNSDEHPDLILLDIMMPGISGFELLQRIKSSVTLSRIPVIMISALGEIDAVVNCIKAGAEDYLPKPFNRVLLNTRINACLKRRQLEKNILKEKKRADDLLGAILPQDIVAELKESNKVSPRRHDEIAVLFADIVNFTQFCEKHKPKQVLSLLQKLVVAWEESAAKYQVEKIKTIGDAFMAASGFQEGDLSPVESCIRCGAEMIEATQDLDIGWNLRVGIHVGPVVAGVLGKCKFAFDLWGDTVNTASRMESHGVAGSIVLTADSLNSVDHCFAPESLGRISVKGKGNVEVVRIDPAMVR